MTARAKKATKTTRGKSKGLVLSKKTVKDLTPRSRGGTVLGGGRATCTCL